MTSTTTSTTLAAQLLSGKKLLLTDDPAKPRQRELRLVSKDPAISLGAGNGSADDPTLAGGTLRVMAVGGDEFDTTYDLPAAAWKLVGKPGAGKGYKLKKATPIELVLVKAGKLIKVVAKGADLGHSLDSDPGVVKVVLTLGEQRYCMEFGGAQGTVQFKPEKKFLARDVSAPGSCLAASSSGGAFVD